MAGYAEEGYFTTSDYLDYVNGSALVLMTNTTIPEGGTITVELSEDNATWTLNDWDPLSGGFEAIDLRDLNFSAGFIPRLNMTSDSFDTPRVYQLRLVTTEGPDPAAPGETEAGDVDLSPFIALAIILSVVTYLLAREM